MSAIRQHSQEYVAKVTSSGGFTQPLPRPQLKDLCCYGSMASQDSQQASSPTSACSDRTTCISLREMIPWLVLSLSKYPTKFSVKSHKHLLIEDSWYSWRNLLYRECLIRRYLEILFLIIVAHFILIRQFILNYNIQLWEILHHNWSII